MSDNKLVSLNQAKNGQSKQLPQLPHSQEVSSQVYLTHQEIAQISSTIDDVYYHWDVASGKITYSENIENNPQHFCIKTLSNAAGFNNCLYPNGTNPKHDVIFNNGDIDKGAGVEFSVEYHIKCFNKPKIKTLDKGSWFVGKDGKPETVIGVMRFTELGQISEPEATRFGTHDALTGLVNRDQLRDQLNTSVTTFQATHKTGAFLLIGIDNLAMINQSYGIDVADEAINLVAQKISKLIRKTDIVGRYSGNKFGIILNDCATKDISIAALRLIEAVNQDIINTTAEAVPITLSAGAVSIPFHSILPADIMQFAEEALSATKSKPVDSFTIYQPSLERDNYRKKNILIADEIVSALNERRVNLYYQPIVSAKDGLVTSYECLVRIANSSGVLIPNGELIPIAEKLNLARLLDTRVLELTVDKLYKHPDIKLSVNISANTIAEANWINYLSAQISKRKDIGQRLTIEITETSLLNDVEGTNIFIEKLHQLGCSVSIDDFGSGYTSFQNLKTLNIDILKIDGSFIKNFRDSKSDRYFVKTMKQLADYFQVKSVAEWVEHEDDVIALREMGINYFQGHYFAKAEPDILPSNHDGQVILGDIFRHGLKDMPAKPNSQPHQQTG